MSESPGLDPALLASPDMRAALAQRDLASVYRLLRRVGLSQRQIAAMTGQSKSDISGVLQGRQVQAYDVLVRICEGLGIPREAMGLSFGAYAVGNPVTVPGEEDLDEVLRRQFEHLLALAGVAAFGSAIPGVGSLDTAPAPVTVADVPSRVGRADVVVVRDLTRAVADAARTQGGQAGPAAALAGWADQFLRSQATDKARRDLLVALSDLHVIAAWCCHDSAAPVQLGMLAALAQALMSPAGVDAGAARSALADARDGWSAPSPHSRADFDLTTAMVYMNLGKIDAAETMASTAVRTFAAGSDRREGILADIILARLHVSSGDRDAARLAAQAVEGVIPTRSGVARAALAPLADDLESRRRSDFTDLARRARQVAST